MTTKEKILYTSLALFADQGIRATPLSQIAKEVGIAKPSLYNHFKGKEAIVEEMYEYFREQAVKENPITLQEIEENIKKQSAKEILLMVVTAYDEMYAMETMRQFWTLIHSEKLHDQSAYRIVMEETTHMTAMTKWLFGKLADAGKLTNNILIDERAECFAYAIQSIQIELLMLKRHNSDKENYKKHVEAVISAAILESEG